VFGYIFAFGAGALVAYFVDPDRGKRRRNMARDRSFSMMRRFGGNASKTARHAGDTAYGIRQEMAHAPEIHEALDDATLARKVESEIFRDGSIPKGEINVNAEEGVIVLRGQVERPDQILAVEQAVRRIPDVLDVQNFLHLPGQAAPNKADSITAERPPTTTPTDGGGTTTEELPREGGSGGIRAA
jgi:osmotically-inducible protein OsmY